MWKEKVVDWLIRYVLRERRIVRAYATSYSLVDVSPTWRPRITITYENTPIEGFYYHFFEFKNEGNRSVHQLPFRITLSPTAMIAWPIQFPEGCFQNLAFPTPNVITGQVDFINRKEKVTLGFWAFNDTAGTSSVSARAPDVEFQTKPWKPEVSRGIRIGAVLHQIIFWVGAVIVLSALCYGAYRGGKFVYRHVAGRVSSTYSHAP